MRPVDLSLVIPTFDSLGSLREVVAAVEAQRDAPPFELVVVVDGSTDGTVAFLESHRFTIPATIVVQDNRGPAHARNTGVRAASGDLVAFLGDDTVPDPHWIAMHCEAHRRRGNPPALAVLGYTGWHARIRSTPFLAYLNDYGKQFGYALIDDPENLPFQLLYASNLSLRRELVAREPFDERFRHAMWEDTELGYRLVRKHAVRIVYEPRARAQHDHPTDLERFARRQELSGEVANLFYELHPEHGPMLGLSPSGPIPLPSPHLHRLRWAILRRLEPLALRTVREWERALRYHYVVGLHRGWSNRRT